MAAGYGYVLSEPVHVHWRGWESDTRRLQSAGWQISAKEDVFRDTLQVAIRHPETEMCGVSYAAKWHYQRLREAGGWLNLPFELQMEVMGKPIYSRELMSSVRGWSAGTGNYETGPWRAVDATPQFTMEQAKRIEDIVHFASLERQKDVIIRPESVPELMDKILKLQQPMREQHFREQAKEARAAATVHARLISIAG
jgi:hypothetical protein